MTKIWGVMWIVKKTLLSSTNEMKNEVFESKLKITFVMKWQSTLVIYLHVQGPVEGRN